MNDYSIRLATREDAKDVLSLMCACFGERDFLNEKWYYWFNFHCPTGHNRNYIAIDNTTGHFVGGYGLLPIRIKTNDQIVDGSLCTNVMTHPEHQGKGLFTQMGRYCIANEEKYGSKLVLGVPNQNAYRGHMKVGWRHISDLVFIAKFTFRNKPFISREIPIFDTRIDTFLHEVAKHANFMVVKDRKFLNWRYPQRPDKKYKLFIFERNGNIDGYMILKHFDANNYKKTHILDIMAQSKEAFDDLILAAEYHTIGRDELNCWQIKHSIYEKYFADNCFVETKNKDIFIIHTKHEDKMGLVPSSWWIALGDNDAY